MDPSARWTQQLAEFVASVSPCTTETAAARATVEQAAEVLDADVAAIMVGDELLAAVGYAEGTEPLDELKRIQPGAQDYRLEVPGVGWCAVAAAGLAYPAGATLVLARRDGLTREETALLGGMARVAAMTMTMLSLLDRERGAREEVEWLAREQAALRRVATLVAKAVSPEEIFSAVAEELGKLSEADIALMLRYEAGDAGTVVGHWSRSEMPGRIIGTQLKVAGTGVVASVHRTGRPARNDVFAGPPGSVAEWLRQAGVRVGNGSPIVVDGRLWGVVVTASRRPDGLRPEAERRMPAFTELVVTAIANAQARVELRALAEEQAALRRVATLVARGVPSVAVFDAVTEEIGRLLPADVTLLCRYDPDGYLARIGEWSRTHDPLPRGGRVRLGGRNVARRVFETGRSARIDEFGDDVGLGMFAWRSAGLRSAVGAPISVEGRLWGLVVVLSTPDEPLPADTEARLTGFTELVATAIANAEANAELKASRARIAATADQTRRRIERDLHDGAQQRLVTLALQIRAAQARVPAQLDELASELDHVAAGLSSTLDELREFSRGIHPAILAHGGLAPALKMLVRRSSALVTLDMRLPGRLPEDIEVTAYYVISEALTNAAKHAKASTVHVRVDTASGVLRLDVRDDGVGGADPARGSGLIGLRDRVEASGGTFRLNSRHGKGTHLLIELPFLPSQPAS
jgi:signal transduction histidine kinase